MAVEDGLFTWELDHLTGVYKNFALSEKVLEQAAYEFQVAQFGMKIPGFGKNQGGTVNIPHWKHLSVPSDYSKLSEDMRIPISKMEWGTTNITVYPYGHGLEVSSLTEQLSKYKHTEPIQKSLREQMRHAMDNAAGAALDDAKVCAIPTGAATITWDTDGTPSTAATNNLTVDHMGIIRDYMFNDLKIPPYEKGYYIGLMSTKALRGIKTDTLFQRWNQYLQKGDVLFLSEVGMVENIRCVENRNTDVLTNGVGTGSVLGEGFIFGDEALAIAEIEPCELRFEPNYGGDFGRTKAVAWYGIMGHGLWWATANAREAKVVRLTSS